jgi:hypothetical protein
MRNVSHMDVSLDTRRPLETSHIFCSYSTHKVIFYYYELWNRLVFVSSCFLFYILQGWFRNVYKALEKTIEFFHDALQRKSQLNPAPPPKRPYDVSRGQNRYVRLPLHLLKLVWQPNVCKYLQQYSGLSNGQSVVQAVHLVGILCLEIWYMWVMKVEISIL